jgi:hypothetical protein
MSSERPFSGMTIEILTRVSTNYRNVFSVIEAVFELAWPCTRSQARLSFRHTTATDVCTTAATVKSVIRVGDSAALQQVMTWTVVYDDQDSEDLT